MFGGFRRPVGPAADVRELEYVSALHQTTVPHARSDGTVSSIDVIRYLRSRFGLVVSEQDAADVVKGLGGGSPSEDVLRGLLGVSSSADDDEETGGGGAGGGRISLKRGGSGDGTTKKRKSSLLDKIRRRKSRRASSASGSDDAFVENGHSDGDDDGDDEGVPPEYLDLVQMESVILMPTLARAGKEWRDRRARIEAGLPSPERRGSGSGDDVANDDDDDAGCLERRKKAKRNAARRTKEDFLESLRPKPEGLLGDVLRTMLSNLEADAREGGGEEEEGRASVVAAAAIAGGEGREREPDRSGGEGAGRDRFTFSSPSSPSSTATSIEYPKLDETLVRRLLKAHKEYERAADADLVKSMVDLATGGDYGDVVLDEEAFVQALTGDLDSWEIGCEDRLTTTFFDVFGYETFKEKEVVEGKGAEAVNGDDLGGGGEGPNDGEAEGGVHDDDDASEKVVKDILDRHSRATRGDGSWAVDKGGTEEGGFASRVASADDDAVEMTAPQANNRNDPPSEKKQSIFADEPREKGDDKTVHLGTHDVKMPTTYAFIDFALDTHRSRTTVVAIWVFYIMTALTYIAVLQSLQFSSANCDPSFGCTLVKTIWSWFTLAVLLVTAGLVVIVPISLANNPTIRSFKTTGFSLLVTITYTVLPYILMSAYEKRAEEPYDAVEETTQSLGFQVGLQIAFACGLLLSVLFSVQLVANFIPASKIRSSDLLRTRLASHNVQGGYDTKIAGTRKSNELLANARNLHPRAGKSGPTMKHRSDVDKTMINFVLRGESEVDAGGFLWTWRRIVSGDLYRTEGIWINTRLFVLQCAQLVIIVFTGIFLFYGTILIADEADKNREEIDKRDDLPQWIYDLVPTGSQVKWALFPASSVAMAVAVVLFGIYVPSTVGTILKFRTGVNPSLRSNKFFKYRVGVDTVYMNVGNAVFAMFGSAMLFFFFVALFLFLIIWPFSREFISLIFAWGIGLTVTILLKTFLMSFFRSSFYAALYRTRPAAANLATLALECWHIGLGGGILVGRFTQFILAACFWVGRIDVPFLSTEVNLAGYGFDATPTNFVKDILGHEAHRHPFIERLGAMYLMRLKHGRNFSSEAGACWRNLFVVALMPWMMKYRVFSDERLAIASDEFEERVARSPEAKEDTSLRYLGNKAMSAVLDTAGEYAVDETPNPPPRRNPHKPTTSPA